MARVVPITEPLQQVRGGDAREFLGRFVWADAGGMERVFSSGSGGGCATVTAGRRPVSAGLRAPAGLPK